MTMSWEQATERAVFIGSYGGGTVVEPCTDLMGAFQRDGEKSRGKKAKIS